MLPTPLPVLAGPRVTLRRPGPHDVAARLAIGRHAEIVRASGGAFAPAVLYTRDEAEWEIAVLADQP